jgi:hypothetical protein
VRVCDFGSRKAPHQVLRDVIDRVEELPDGTVIVEGEAGAPACRASGALRRAPQRPSASAGNRGDERAAEHGE